MSIASLNQFPNEVMQDSALQEQFKTVAATSPENLFTTSEVEQALAAQNAATETGELSDEQLEVVAGGYNQGKAGRELEHISRSDEQLEVVMGGYNSAKVRNWS